MRKNRIVICALAAFVLALCAGTAGAWDGSSAPFIIGGDDDVGDAPDRPVMIESAEQLAYLAEMVNSGDKYSGKYFKLANDIDLSGHDWVPIGIGNGTANDPSAKCFSGNFDGGGKVIRGLTIISDDCKIAGNIDALGLFGFVRGTNASDNLSLITGIRIEDAVISVDRTSGTFFFTGILAGQTRNCAVEDCVATGEVRLNLDTTGTKPIGGLIGRGYTAAKVSRSFANASIEVATEKTGLNVGGLIGITNGDVVRCGSAGSVSVGTVNTQTNAAGGLIGQNGAAISVDRCFSTSAIAIDASSGTNTTTSYAQGAGGLIGYAFYNIKLVDSFSLGPVSATGYKAPVGSSSSFTGAGGLAGLWGSMTSSSGKTSFVAKTSYAYGGSSATDASIGGLFGLAAPYPNSGTNSADDCFWLADRYEAPVEFYGRYVSTYGTAPVKSNGSKGLTANDLKTLPNNFKNTIWGYSPLDASARPQLLCFVDGGKFDEKLVTLTTAKIAISAGETKRVSYSALGLENEASFSLSATSVGGVSIAPDDARPGTFVITAPNETKSGRWTVEISAAAADSTPLPTKILSIVVGDGKYIPGEEAGDDDEAATGVKIEVVDLPADVISQMSGKTVVSRDMFERYGKQSDADPDLFTLSETTGELRTIARSNVVSYDLGGKDAAMMGANFTVDATDADGASFWYAYADGSAKGRSAPVKIIGDGGIWSWDEAAARGMIELSGGTSTMKYIITNEPGADQSPYEVGGWIAIPDGEFNDMIVDPIFVTAPTSESETPASAGSSGGGCSVGASLAAAAMLFALRRRR